MSGPSLPLPPSVSLPGSRQPHDALFHWVILLLCCGVLLAAALLKIGDSGVALPGGKQRLPELCMLRRTTGLSCPGCGLTRCFISIAHGDLAAAWSFNPAGLWLFAIIALQLPLRSYQLWRIKHGRQELKLVTIGAIAFVVFFIALLSQWAFRLFSTYL